MVSFSEPSVRFNDGDEVAIEFCAKDEDGGVVDLTGLTITAQVWAKNAKVYDLTTALNGGIEILDPNPPAESDPEDQKPQGVIRLTEAQAQALPFGRLSWIKMITVLDGFTDSSQPIWLNKVLP